jgi:hypothetical protein
VQHLGRSRLKGILSHVFAGAQKHQSPSLSVMRPAHHFSLAAVQYCTQRTHALAYAQTMQLKYSKLIAVTIWLVTIAILGLLSHPTSS